MDNTTVTAGTGTTIATDEIGGVHYQINKIGFGVLDSLTLVSASNGLPVSFAAGASVGLAAGAAAIGTVSLNAALPTGTNSIGTVVLGAGTNTLGSVKITDGTNVPAVKAGVVAVVGDNPLVVTLHPSSAPTATQPVSIATMPSTPVTGTFFQGTQPVSIATMPSTPVTGTFWQATQPVSLTSTTLTGTSAVSLATLPALTTGAAVIGAVTQSGTWNVGSITTLPALATGANVIGGVTQSGTWNIGTITTLPALVAGSAIVGKVGFDQTTPGTTNAVSLSQINATTVATGNGISGAGVQRVNIASDNTPIPITRNDTATSGTITATDIVVAAPGGAGAMVTGTPTAGSTVVAALPGAGDSAWNVSVTGLTSGTLYFEESLDSTTGIDGNWINVNGRQSGITNTTIAASLTVNNSAWRGNTSGAKYFRVRSSGALTGTPLVIVRVSNGTGAVYLNASLPAGTNTIGAVNIAAAQTIAVTQATPASLQTTNTPATPTASIINSAATTNATSIKGSAGTIYSITMSNAGAAAAFVKIYNNATAPTVGTTLIAQTYAIPASGQVMIEFGPLGMRFGTGIALAITNLVAEADATAVALNQVKVLMSYI